MAQTDTQKNTLQCKNVAIKNVRLYPWHDAIRSTKCCKIRQAPLLQVNIKLTLTLNIKIYTKLCFNCFLSSHIIFLSSVLLNQSRSSCLQVAPPFWFWTTVLDSPTEGSQKSGTVRFAILVPFIMEMQIIAYHTGTILYCK